VDPAADRGRLTVLSGPSGVGKSTVVRELRARRPEVWLSVSATTRHPRPGERHGVHYHFVDDATFDADMDDPRGISLHHRLGHRHRLRRAAAHDRKLPLLGARLSARNRRIDAQDALPPPFLGQPPRDLRRDGGVIDEQRPFAHVAEGAVMAERHLLQIIVRADAADDDVRTPGCGRRRRRQRAAVPRHPVARLVGGAVVDGDMMLRGSEVTRHGRAHHAEPDECDPCHKHQR